MNTLQRLIANATGMQAEVNALKAQVAQAVEQRGDINVVMTEILRENRKSAGNSVTPGNALSVTAYWACLRVLSETVGSLPLITYERLPQGKARAQQHRLYRLLHDQPNELMTAISLRETMTLHMASWGNAYALLIYDESGQVVEIWPMRPDRVLEKRTQGNRRLYHYQWDNGRMEWLSNDEVWQIPGLGGNGLDGYSVATLFRRSLGLAMDTEEFGSRFFSNDARPGIILEHPGKLGDVAHKNLRESIDEDHLGVEKSHRPMILEEGMKLHEVGIPPEDAQFLQTRQFQVREIARMFRMPPHMIQDLEQATFANIEHQGIEFVVHTLRPYLVRWEQGILKDLINERERGRIYAEHLVDGLLRGDIKSRYEAYAVGRQNGWLSANDIRELENMNPIDGGNVYLVPMNMIPADQVSSFGLNNSSGGGSPDTARSLRLLASKESRAQRSAASRQRLGQAYQQVLLDAADRVMRREANYISTQAEKHFTSRDSTSFLLWLEEFEREHQEWVFRQLLPILNAFMALIAREAVDEVGVDQEVGETVDRYSRSYTGSMAHQEAGISQYRMKAALQKALNDGIDPLEAVNVELDAWRENRPAEIADEQKTRAQNAMAKVIYQMVGIQILRWVSTGDSCPFCQRMNGKTASITKTFVAAGEGVDGDGGDAPMTSTTDIGHPPLHKGCDCLIMAG